MKARTRVITAAVSTQHKYLPAKPKGGQIGRWLFSVLAFSWLQAQGVIYSLCYFSVVSVTAVRLVPSAARTVRGMRCVGRPAVRKRGERDEGQGWRCWGEAVPACDRAVPRPFGEDWEIQGPGTWSSSPCLFPQDSRRSVIPCCETSWGASWGEARCGQREALSNPTGGHDNLLPTAFNLLCSTALPRCPGRVRSSSLRL